MNCAVRRAGGWRSGRLDGPTVEGHRRVSGEAQQTQRRGVPAERRFLSIRYRVATQRPAHAQERSPSVIAKPGLSWLDPGFDFRAIATALASLLWPQG